MADAKTAPAIDDDPFSTPGTSEFVDWKDINGALIVLEVEEFVSKVPTVHGDNDAIRADLHVLDGELSGETYEGTLIFGRSMVPQLKRRVGEMVLCRVGQGAKQKGKHAPWQLHEATDDDKKIGMAWWLNRKPADPFSDADEPGTDD